MALLVVVVVIATDRLPIRQLLRPFHRVVLQQAERAVAACEAGVTLAVTSAVVAGRPRLQALAPALRTLLLRLWAAGAAVTMECLTGAGTSLRRTRMLPRWRPRTTLSQDQRPTRAGTNRSIQLYGARKRYIEIDGI